MRTVAAALLASAAAFSAAAGDWGPLLTPAELAARGDALVIDIRPASGKASFAEGHVPGAVNAPYALWRGPKENPGQLPDAAALTEVLRAAGVTFDRPVAIVHHGADHNEFGAAARVYWTLKSVGHPELAILNGGHRAWVEAGLPVGTDAAAPVRSDVTAQWSDVWTATREEVAAAERGDSGALLVDARPDEFFRGLRKHDAAAEPGTLFGAVSFVHDRWFRPQEARVTVSEEALARARALADEADGAAIVSFCNTGHWAATNWFALSELAGVEGVKLYPESVVGWTRAGLPLSPGS